MPGAALQPGALHDHCLPQFPTPLDGLPAGGVALMPPPSKPLPVVGDAAGATPGSGSGTTASSDWLAEIKQVPGTDPRQGVPVATRSKGDRHRGRAVESKRGQRG